MSANRSPSCGTSQAIDCLLNALAFADAEGSVESERCQRCDQSIADLEEQLAALGKRFDDSANSFVQNEAVYLRRVEQQFAADAQRAHDVDASSGLVGPISVGHYEILGPLGRGGMGQVFRARHTKLNKLVALKIIREGGQHSRTMAARFELEMQAVGQLEHPHVVHAIDAGEAAGISYLSMELLDGVDFGILVDGEARDVADACEVIR